MLLINTFEPFQMKILFISKVTRVRYMLKSQRETAHLYNLVKAFTSRTRRVKVEFSTRYLSKPVEK